MLGQVQVLVPWKNYICKRRGQVFQNPNQAFVVQPDGSVQPLFHPPVE